MVHQGNDQRIRKVEFRVGAIKLQGSQDGAPVGKLEAGEDDQQYKLRLCCIGKEIVANALPLISASIAYV